jgi:hypothetical protein
LKRRGVAIALAALLLAGCSSWHATTVPEPAPGAPAPQSLGTVQVRLADGRTLEVHHATADVDSIRGDLARDKIMARHGRRVAFARSDVRVIEQRGFSTGKTMGLIVVLAATAGLALEAVIGAIVGGESD